jgi:hypothetical protein|tara:strand:+ start:2119 stop:2382 length:264 start_codon:yes stop_codon:yes gene_type:complete
MNNSTDPIVHLNGTSGESLVEQRLDIVEALVEVEKAIGQAWPHGRDFYPQGPDALAAAQQVWKERVRVVADLRDEINEEALRIFSQE